MFPTVVSMLWALLLGCIQECIGSPHPGLMKVAAWPGVDLQFPSPVARSAALASGAYDPSNMTVWSILVHENRMFLFSPNQFMGTYSTVNFVYLNELDKTERPKMRPYPATFNNNITSVFRAAISCQDHCMYFVDDGVESFYGARIRRHPPRLFRAHLPSDTLELLYTLGPDDYTEDSLFTNLAVDRCPLWNGVEVVYISDLAQYAIVVVDLKTNTSHRVKHPYFIMDPFSPFLATAAGDRHTFLADGVAALSLSESLTCSCEKTLFFASSGGRHVFAVSTETLRNRTLSSDTGRYRVLGYKGEHSQSNNMVYDADSQVLFYAATQDNTLYCWNTEEELTPRTQRPMMRDDSVFRTPNDLEADCCGTLWALSNNWVSVLRRGATHSATGGADIVVLRGDMRQLAAACTTCDN